MFGPKSHKADALVLDALEALDAVGTAEPCRAPQYAALANVLWRSEGHTLAVGFGCWKEALAALDARALEDSLFATKKELARAHQMLEATVRQRHR